MRTLLTLLLLTCSVASVSAQIVASGLVAGGNGSCPSGQATAAFTPTANALVIACLTMEHTATVGTATMSGNGLTWVEVENQVTGNGFTRTVMFRAMGAAPTNATTSFTITGSSSSGCTWAIGQFTGIDTSGSNGSGAIVGSAVKNVQGSTTSLAVTLPALSSTSNVAAACFGSNGTGAITPDTTPVVYTELIAQHSGAPNRTALISDANDTTPSVTAATTTLLGIGIEIKQATATTRRKRPPIVWE